MRTEYDHFAASVADQLPRIQRSRSGDDYDSGHLDQSFGSRLQSISDRGYRRAAFIIMSVTLVVLTGRLLFLQVVHGSTYRAIADQNHIRTVSIPAPRGSIIDRYGSALVTNVPNFILTVTPADLPIDPATQQELIKQIGGLAGLDPAAIKAALSDRQYRRTDPIPILEHIEYEPALKLMVAMADFPGVSMKVRPTRSYPVGPAAAHLLGYVGKISTGELVDNPQATILDMTGKSGLEKTYNHDLTGRDGIQYVERDVSNRQRQILRSQDPAPGRTVQISIDGELQQRLYDRLSSAVKTAHSPGGAAVALDPMTGQVLAMVSSPSYDTNWFVTGGHDQDIEKTLTGKNKPLLNRAVSGQYPSGSIIKPFIAAGALAEKIVTPSTTVLSTGGFRVGRDDFPDWKSGGHGLTNLAKAIAESVNTYFYAIGGGYLQQRGLGVDRIVKYLRLFGWGQILGIDVPSEVAGFLPTKEWRQQQRPSPWKLGDTYHLSIGQGDVSVTPLQIAAGVAAIANGGTLYRPYVVTGIFDPAGQPVKTIAPHPLGTAIVSRQVMGAVQAGMRQGVVSGSSRALQSLPVTAAGKTGTAQFGNQGKTHSWYAVYAPYDRPRIVLAIIVEAGGEGNDSALPVAKDILQWYFTRGQNQPAVDKPLTRL